VFLAQRIGLYRVSGGLEVASDRLLNLIKKGVTVDQVAQVTRNFTESGIMVHAYLMYGFPSQTVQETVDSLEMVRQMFELGIIESGFWHQFAMTAHAPVGFFPEEFGVVPIYYDEILFANNDVNFKDKTGINHEKFSFGLKKSLFNYMHGICFDFPLQDWFDFKIPKTSIPPDYITSCLEKEVSFTVKSSLKVIWIGEKPQVETFTKSKKGQQWQMTKLIFQNKTNSFDMTLDNEVALWLMETLEKTKVSNYTIYTFSDLKSDYETTFEDFELFWFSKPMNILKQNGLLVL
jgi:hypothetical protein